MIGRARKEITSRYKFVTLQYLFTVTGPACQIRSMNDTIVKIPRGRRSHRLWQDLVDSAHALLTIDSCRQYGLVTGGPECDVERCRKVLEEGRAGGFSPRRIHSRSSWPRSRRSGRQPPKAESRDAAPGFSDPDRRAA